MSFGCWDGDILAPYGRSVCLVGRPAGRVLAARRRLGVLPTPPHGLASGSIARVFFTNDGRGLVSNLDRQGGRLAGWEARGEVFQVANRIAAAGGLAALGGGRYSPPRGHAHHAAIHRIG